MKKITLELNETFTNNTDKDIIYQVKYLNCLGYYQTEVEVLKPKQTVIRTQPLNRIYIFL